MPHCLKSHDTAHIYNWMRINYSFAPIALSSKEGSCEPVQLRGTPEVLGIWGERLFIYRELWGIGNYFQGSGEQAHSFGDLGSPAKK